MLSKQMQYKIQELYSILFKVMLTFLTKISDFLQVKSSKYFTVKKILFLTVIAKNMIYFLPPLCSQSHT